MFRNWLKSVFQTKSTARPRAQFSIKALEDRTTPSILFTPHEGLVQPTAGGGPILGGTSDVHIYLDFWGSYWNTNEGRAYSDQILRSIDPIFYNSPYLNGLHQYGIQHRAYNDPRPGTGQAAVDGTTVSSGFSVSDAEAKIAHAINNGIPFDSNNLYFVVTPPGIQSDQTDSDGTPFDGYHTYQYVTDRSSGRSVPLYFGWIGTDGTIDHATRFLSHEVVEAMTDPHLDAWRDYTVPGPENEIADREAESYTARVNGYLVQSYWSPNDRAYKVDNGTSQTFYMHKDPNDVLNTRNQLVINGDQYGSGYNDTITIDVNAAGGVSVNLNGEVLNFDPDTISSIVVNTGAGSNSVYVNNEAQDVGLTINDGGNDYVSVGSQGSAQGIRGAVQINSPSGHTQLVINDSADTVARTAFIDSIGVTGLAPGNISFGATDLSYLMIYGGSGGNTYYVHDTPSTYNGVSAGYTWLSTGAGVDTVYVDGTTGDLYVNGLSGHDYVYVGTDTSTANPAPGRGTLANIKGFVYAFNPSGVTTLVVDDAADTTAHVATLNANSLTGLSVGAIYWAPTSSSFTGGVDELHIYGSAAPSTYYVTDSPNAYFGTDLNTGAGDDAVFITGTTGFFGTYNRGGFDRVYVGNGTLTGVRGSVNVAGSGSTSLVVQDYLDTTAHSATLTRYGLMGLAAGTIWWVPSSAATGGVTYLSVMDGAAGSTFVVTDTPALYSGVNLNTGAGNDYVSITGTTGRLNVNNPNGYDTVYVGSGGTLANINGAVSISGNGSIYLYVSDYLDTTTHTATLTATSLTGLSQGAIQWVPSATATGGVILLDITGSAAGSTYNVTGTPSLYYDTQLSTGAGSDSVSITGTTGNLYLYNSGGADTVVIGRPISATSGGKVAAIKGRVSVSGAGSTALTVDDSGDTNGRGATLTANSLAGPAPAEIDFSTGVTSLTFNGGTGNDTLAVTGIPSGIPVTFNGSAGGDTLVGPNITNFWNVTGNASGTLDGTVNFSNVESLVGGIAVDSFVFGAVGRLSNISGGGAPAGQGDWLDYTAATTAVSANLSTGKVSGVTGTASGIQNVLGGNFGNTLTGNAQGNILIGGDGIDRIIGGSGRSLLVGGNGADTITGGADDDIVIGGTTSYGSAWHEAELMDLLARWQSADSYATRVANLRSGSRPLVPGTTVFDDGAADRVSGAGGTDWFLVGATDSLPDRQTGEAIN